MYGLRQSFWTLLNWSARICPLILSHIIHANHAYGAQDLCNTIYGALHGGVNSLTIKAISG
jgi:hypothetical protein